MSHLSKSKQLINFTLVTCHLFMHTAQSENIIRIEALNEQIAISSQKSYEVNRSYQSECTSNQFTTHQNILVCHSDDKQPSC